MLRTVATSSLRAARRPAVSTVAIRLNISLSNDDKFRRNYCASPALEKKWYDNPPVRGIPVEEVDGVLLDAEGNIVPPEDDPDYVMMLNSEISQEEAKDLVDTELAKHKAEQEQKLYKDWKPGQRKRPLMVSYNLEDFDDSIERWTHFDRRCGALGIKMGMMPIWDDWGERHACTVLYLDSNVVIRNKIADGPDGYDAVQIGGGERKKKSIKRALLAQYEKYGVAERPPWIVREFRVTTKDAMPNPGTRIHASHFVPGQNIDVSGTSKGKGFQGTMKKWNFAGMPASHGTSKSHRALGSTGSCKPGRVFKGKKMAGKMGNERVTIQNLRVVKVDRGRDLLYVKGAIPGNKGEFVEVRDAVKRPLWGTEKVSGGKERTFPPLPTFEYDEGVDGCGDPGHEWLMPLAKSDPFEPNMTERELTYKE